MTTILGHDAPVAEFLAVMRGERPPHAWLLAGIKGLGKASLAKLFARRLLAEAVDPARAGDAALDLPPDHPTARLADAHSHPDLILLDCLPKDDKSVRDLDPRDWPADLERARSITIKQVREMSAACTLKPALSMRRVVIVDAVDELERGGANALLKTVEEPPAGTIFLLVSHAPGRLLPTIRSRCRLLRFRPLPDDVMAAVIRRELPDATDIPELVARGGGAPGRAIPLAGQKIDDMRETFRRIAASGDRDNVLRQSLAARISGKSARPQFEALLTLVPEFLSDHARSQRGVALARSIKAWEEARDLASQAIPGSLDPPAVALALGGLIATLAPEPPVAKG